MTFEQGRPWPPLVKDNHTGDTASALGHQPCGDGRSGARLGGRVPHLQGGQVLGQLLLELNGRQSGRVGHELSLGQGAALRGALAGFLLSFFTFPGISVKSGLWNFKCKTRLRNQEMSNCHKPVPALGGGAGEGDTVHNEAE